MRTAQSLLPFKLLMISWITIVESINPPIVAMEQWMLITLSLLLDMVLKLLMENQWTIGLLRILGQQNGEMKDTLRSKEVSICVESATAIHIHKKLLMFHQLLLSSSNDSEQIKSNSQYLTKIISYVNN